MNIFEAYHLIQRGCDLKIMTPEPGHMARKLQEEVNEIVEVMVLDSDIDHDRLVDEMGDALVCLLRIAYHLDVSPALALKHAIRKVSSRFDEMDKILKGGGMTRHNLTRTDAINLYKNAKCRVNERKEVTCGHDSYR